MNYNIITTYRFEKELKRLIKKFPSLKIEFIQFIEELKNNSTSGIYLGNNCYKIRLGIKSKGKGKSGGFRIITYVYAEMEVVYLLTIYDKTEKPDLKVNEVEDMIQNLKLE
jgi:mRNA-degrading endonuclease RelE of RelBE toxin-antitoxin system